MNRIKNVLKFSVILVIITCLVGLSYSIQQTHKFLNNNVVSFPEKVRPHENEIYLISTWLKPQSTFNKDSLYKTLEEIQPDIVLLPYSSSFFSQNRVKWPYRMVIPKYLNFKPWNNLEFMAATKYAERHPEVDLKPFEWEMAYEIRKQTHGESRADMFRALSDSRTDSAMQMIHQCAKSVNYAKGLLTFASINNFRTDQIMRRFSYLEYEILPGLILKNDSLEEFHENAQNFRNYKASRNFNMVHNILKIVKSDSEKRIVVLTHYSQRHSLRKLLSEKSMGYEFKLFDFGSQNLIFPGHQQSQSFKQNL